VLLLSLYRLDADAASLLALALCSPLPSINMSWQSYVDQQLVGSGSVSLGAILGLDGSVWAKSAALNISAAEAKALTSAFANPAGAQSTGLFFGGASNKYLLVKADDQSIYGKLKAGGFAAAKTNQSVVLGFYAEGTQPGQCNTVVERLADYLKENGY